MARKGHQPSVNWRIARRRRIVEAAERVFSRAGYAAASMDDIAVEAAVGKPTLYRYFASKDALFLAVFEEALDDLDQRIVRVASASGAPAERLRAIVAALVPFFRQQFATWRDLGAGGVDVEQSRRRLLRARRNAIEAQIADVITAGERDGAFRPGIARTAAHVLVGAVWGGATATPGSDASLVEAITDLFLNGVVVPVSDDIAPRARQRSHLPASIVVSER